MRTRDLFSVVVQNYYFRLRPKPYDTCQPVSRCNGPADSKEIQPKVIMHMYWTQHCTPMLWRVQSTHARAMRWCIHVDLQTETRKSRVYCMQQHYKLQMHRRCSSFVTELHGSVATDCLDVFFRHSTYLDIAICLYNYIGSSKQNWRMRRTGHFLCLIRGCGTRYNMLAPLGAS